MKTLKKIQDLLNDNNIELSIEDYKLGEFKDFDELMYELQQHNALQVEIIYYNTAMDYLKENDPGLQYSLELAHDLGYELKSLNSETLASILATDELRRDLNKLENEINSIINN